jgi:hypothetical protein
MSNKSARAQRSAFAAIVGATVLAASSIGLASPAAAIGTLDQSATGSDGGGSDLQNTSMTLSQTFTAGMGGQLAQVDLYLSKSGTPTSATLSIKAVDGSGNPIGIALASEVVSAAAISGVFSTIPVVFANPATITAATQYALVLSCQSCASGFPFMSRIGWGTATNSYSDGIADNSNYSPWAGGGLDFMFATYVSLASVAVFAGPTPADVLQQVGLPKSGTCADVDDSKLNWAGVSAGSWTPSWAQWINNGSGGAICGRTLYYAPSGRWAVRS